MLEIPAIGDNLAARISAIILGSFVALALAIVAVMVWPRPGDSRAGLFQLPLPEETAAIVAALEASPAETRPLVVRALNTSVVSVRLEHVFPPVPPGLQRAPKLEWMFRGYSALLADRPFRVDVRRGLLPSLFVIQGEAAPTASVQMSIRLRDGAVLVIERRPAALVRSYIARVAAIAALTGIILLGGLALAIRQTARPVNQLALAARAFSIDGLTPDLPVRGPRELRELSNAFNGLQHRIRDLVAERTRILAAIAHDLRTYLTRLRLRAEFIANEDQRLRAVGDIDDMATLLDDTLLFARQSDPIAAASEACDIAAELRAFVELRRELGDPVEQASELTDVVLTRCAPMALRRMLSNLVDNALRYGGVARVSLVRRDGWIDLVVEDDGPGVPPAELARIIEPFERLEASRGRDTGGTGLGLSIVKGLAEAASGRLELENREVGGLRARLRLQEAVVLGPRRGEAARTMSRTNDNF